jgi:hypothetical protein
VNVSRLGTTQVSGYTSTGLAFTNTGILSDNGRVLLHARLNSNLGIIQGAPRITTSTNISDNTLTGTLMWRKSNSITTTYPSAFGPLTLSVAGGWMGNTDIVKGQVVGVVGGRVQGLPAPATPSYLTFSKGGIAGAAISPNIDPFTFTHYTNDSNPGDNIPGIPGIKANLPAPGSTFNQPRVELRMSARSGLCAGSFQLLDLGRRRTGTFFGALVRAPNAAPNAPLKAVGYFLLPKLPQLGQIGAPETLSGKVTLTQP